MGCFTIGVFYWLLRSAGPGISIVAIGWISLGFAAVGANLDVPWAVAASLIAAALIALGYLSIALRSGSHPRGVWIASLIGLLVPVFTLTVSIVLVTAASSDALLASTDSALLLGRMGLVGAQVLATAVAAFATDELPTLTSRLSARDV